MTWLLFLLFPELLYIALMMLGVSVAGVNLAVFVSDHPVMITAGYVVIVLLLILHSWLSETDSAEDKMFALTMAISSYIPFRIALNLMCSFVKEQDVLLGLFTLLFSGPILLSVIFLICMGIAFFSASLHKYPVVSILLCLAGNGVVAHFFRNLIR